jgi:hypothetical protein
MSNAARREMHVSAHNLSGLLNDSSMRGRRAVWAVESRGRLVITKWVLKEEREHTYESNPSSVNIDRDQAYTQRDQARLRHQIVFVKRPFVRRECESVTQLLEG